MYTSSWCAYVLALAVLPRLVLAAPIPATVAPPTLSSSRTTKPKKGGVKLPFLRRRVVGRQTTQDDDVLGGTVGLGDNADLFYTVAVTVGDSTTSVNLDTGSSDLWVMSDACKTTQCQRSTAKPYDVTKSFKPTDNASVQLQYGDSVSGTHASGPVGRDTVTLAALTLKDQTLAAVDDTDNSAVQNGGAGIMGLGFPAQSFVQAAAINAEFNNPSGTDTFIEQTANYGPAVSRLILADMIDDPLFAVTLQRNTIDVSGQGEITIGQLPDEIDESNITWVPVRLYDPAEGGMAAPSFAPNEKYPLRWEVPIDAVFLDGQKLPTSTQSGAGLDTSIISGLIDTGNSLIRGPQDVVNNIYTKVSPAFAANSNSDPTLPCDAGHNLAFQIGGKMFPVDPRDFVSQNKQGDASTCIANNIVGTDAPSSGALFSWNLGDPFLKSNMVVFYYGNLTHPSVDPPRIGFVSLVPQNADDLLDDAVDDAQGAGGNFESKADAAPTASSLILETSSGASSSAASRTSSPSSTTSSSSPASTAKPQSSSTASGSAPAESTSSSSNAAPPSLRLPPLLGAWPSLLFVSLSMLSSLCIL
ncbi:acid protease [Lentinus tigrinus ALCF2SS1-7]|uniref:Acid protease n=1 Tax=Lentinus tigrinus ALCF2SS1-6 TaxID=1328759 RepID=A0A5C2SHD5_9APHY|nr:acid protease [Lentinus tigrinus ALCF2SS1-6]RPD77696.1 acid protease [Lentinus tigrinus ALCF2SS1-7]